MVKFNPETMQIRNWRKSLILILSATSFVALILLAEALSDVSFRPALRFRQEDAAPIQFAVAKAIDQFVEVPFWQHVLIWMTVFLIVILVSSILSPELRKRIIKTFFRITIIVLTLVFILKNFELGLPILNGEGFQQLGGLDGKSDLPAPPIFQTPQIAPWLLYLVSMCVALLMIGLFVVVSRWWKRQQELLTLGRPLDEIGVIARDSLDELSAGRNWEDVIVNCYIRMSQTVAARRGLHRAQSMTPGEFAFHLEKSGLPPAAVHRLTYLFESVRYGASKSGKKEIDEAMNCLREILIYCGEAA